MAANYKHPYKTSGNSPAKAAPPAPKPVVIKPKVVSPMPVTPGNLKNSGM